MTVHRIARDVWAPSRLVGRVRRNSGLTVVRAPRGYGKSALVTAWSRTARDTGRTVVHLAAPAHSTTADDYWALIAERLTHAGVPGRPVDLVLDRPDRYGGPEVEARVLDLVDECPSVNVVVTVAGRSMFGDPLTIGLHHHTVRSDDLLYTLDDTREIFHAADLHPTDSDVRAVHRRTGGLPWLTAAAVAAARTVRPLSRAVLDRAVTDAAQGHVDDILDSTTSAQRAFLVRTANAHVLTADLARYLGGGPDSTRYLSDLEDAGILDHLDTVSGDTWQLPPAVRTELIAIQCTDGLQPSARSTLLAQHHRNRGEHAAALRCAAEAENWALAVELFDEHGASLAASHLEMLRDVLLALPEAVVADHGGICALRDVVRHLFGGDASDAESSDAADLLDLTSLEDPRAAVSLVGTRILLQRLAGDYASAAEQTHRFHMSLRALLDADPDAISDIVPFLRMQSGLTYQLAGQFAESTVELRLAHRLGAGHTMPYIARNAAGNSALNWAFAGELQRARGWLADEDAIPPADEWTESFIRIGGVVARALVAIDTLDLDTAGRAVDSLRVLPEVAELWPFVTFARCRYALASGEPARGLAALTEYAEPRARAKGTFVQSLLDAIEIEVRLAIGDVARARALADSLSCAAPWSVVAVARTYLLTGDHQSAITTCRKHDWLGTPHARAHLEALVIEAVAACQLGRDEDALRAWTHACAIADRTGICGVFATVERRAVVSLGERTARMSATVAQFLSTPVPEHYPPTLMFPQLTDRELTVLDGVARGLTIGQIAAPMFLSTSTIKTHKRTLYRKLGAHSRAEAIDRAHAFGLLGG